MKKSRIGTLLLVGLSALYTGARAQTVLPYITGFDNAAQQAGWQLFRKGATGSFTWNYTGIMAFTAPQCLYHDYPVGGTSVTDDWFVSPMFHFGAGGRIDSLRRAFAGFGKPSTADTVAIYLLHGSADPSLATSRTLLYDFRGTNYVNDAKWSLMPSIPIPPVTGDCYIAFRYYTIINWLDVKFDNLGLSSNTTDISEIHQPRSLVRYYPNPVTDLLYFNPNTDIREISISDISGRELIRQPFATHIHLEQLNPGSYILRSVLWSGMVIPDILIKQ